MLLSIKDSIYGKLYNKVLFKRLIMDGCVLLSATPECVVSQRLTVTRAQSEWSSRGETIIPIT